MRTEQDYDSAGAENLSGRSWQGCRTIPETFLLEPPHVDSQNEPQDEPPHVRKPCDIGLRMDA